jgi:hypothetical protein
MEPEARSVRYDNARELEEWCGGVAVVEIDAVDPDQSSPGINVPVKGEVKRASLGDMIIRHSDGTFDVYKR